MRHGYKMQLMIYLISASTGKLEPAGMYYFNIKDPIEAADGKSVKQVNDIMERDPEELYKLRGRYINDPGVLGAMPESVIARSKTEEDRSISSEEYDEIRTEVLDRIRETAEGILKGKIDIRPLRESKRLSCNHCGYKSICRRDREYPRNSARELPPKPPKKEK